MKKQFLRLALAEDPCNSVNPKNGMNNTNKRRGEAKNPLPRTASKIANTLRRQISHWQLFQKFERGQYNRKNGRLHESRVDEWRVIDKIAQMEFLGGEHNFPKHQNVDERKALLHSGDMILRSGPDDLEAESDATGHIKLV